MNLTCAGKTHIAGCLNVQTGSDPGYDLRVWIWVKATLINLRRPELISDALRFSPDDGPKCIRQFTSAHFINNFLGNHHNRRKRT